MKKPAHMMVRTSDASFEQWNRFKIVEALVREARMKPEDADSISREIEEVVGRLNIRILSASLIREIVSVKLLEHGLETQHHLHTRLGVPYYDVDRILNRPNHARLPFLLDPHGTNILLAEKIKSEYALDTVFSQEIVEAHLRGDICIHSLGSIDRAAHLRHTVETIKQHGLRIPSSAAFASPARHPEVLLAHIVKFTSVLFNHFSDGILWDSINISFAPFLRGMSEKEIRQFSQRLLFALCEISPSGGASSHPLELGLWWSLPPLFEGRKAIGPGGEIAGKSYEEFLPEARRFVQAIFETYRSGDSSGRPFLNPKLRFTVDAGVFEDPVMDLACSLAREKGNIHFIFRRPETELSPIETLLARPSGRKPKRDGLAIFQTISINLPRLGYLAGDDFRIVKAKLRECMENASRAHIQKRVFLEKLMSFGPAGPLALLAEKRSGEPLVTLDGTAHCILPTGLNELVKIVLGKELHEDEEAIDLGLRVIREMKKITQEMREKHKLNIFLSQGNDEISPFRFAALDLRFHSPAAGHFVNGEIAENRVYYTPSSLLNRDVKIRPFERMCKEGRFHDLFEAGAHSTLWMDGAAPEPREIRRLLWKLMNESRTRSLALEKEYTSCASCGTVSHDMSDSCGKCGSEMLFCFSKNSGRS